MPTVSIIMPMYNSVKYVKQAIESLLNQTYTDIEIIAINDGSKDGCADVVRSISDDRVRFIDRENRGFVSTLNECIELSKGKYIARLDDDDWCYPTRIEKEVAYLNAHPETVLVGALSEDQNSDSIVKEPETPVITPAQIRYSLIFGNYAFTHSSFMMRKEILDNYDIRYEMFKQVPDYHMITQLSAYGDISRIREYLVVYRIHPSQSTQVRSARMKQDEIDSARVWYIDTLKLDENDRKALKRGVLRKLATKDDIKQFDSALEKYWQMCGLDYVNDKKCFDYLYGECMFRQYCCITLLRVCLHKRNKGWLLSSTGIKFVIKCIMGKNPSYLETTVQNEA